MEYKLYILNDGKYIMLTWLGTLIFEFHGSIYDKFCKAWKPKRTISVNEIINKKYVNPEDLERWSRMSKIQTVDFLNAWDAEAILLAIDSDPELRDKIPDWLIMVLGKYSIFGVTR